MKRPTPSHLGEIKLNADLIYRPKGCPECNQIGYRGRACIAEVMVINDAVRGLINEKANYQKLREVARSTGMQTLYESAIKKVEDGATSLEEALSITLGIE